MRRARRSSTAHAALWPLLFAGLFLGCADPLQIVDVSFAPGGDDLSGPYAATALVRGGSGGAEVVLRVAVVGAGGAVNLAGPCAAGFPAPPPRSGQPTDAGSDLAVGGADATSTDATARDATAPDAPDAGLEPVDRAPAACVEFALRRAGDHWTVRWPAPPFPLGTSLRAVLRVEDDEGQVAWWPAGAPEAAVEWQLGQARSLSATDMAPVSGPATGHTWIVVRGDGFAADSQAWFAGRAAAGVRVVSPHLLEIQAPPGQPGPAEVVVESRGQRAVLPVAFQYDAPPRVLRLDPAEGWTARDTVVTLTGADLRPGSVAWLGDPPTAIATEWQGPDRVAVVVPAGPAGPLSITLENPDGQRSGEARFTRWPPPSLEGLLPGQGPDLGGSLLALTGAGLRQPGTVWFGRRAGEVLRVESAGGDAQRAWVVTPVSVAGAVDVRWYNPDGQVATAPLPFTFLGAPEVLAAEPGVTSRCGGGDTTLVGENFSPDVVVRLNGVEAEVLSVTPDGTRVVVRAPPGAAGPVRVQVVNPDGRASRNDDILVYGVQPVIDAVDPPEVPVWGGLGVVIEGADFSADSQVFFGDSPAEQVRVQLSPDGCDAQIFAVEPAGAEGPATVRVASRADGTEAQREAAVTYVAPRLSPPHGLVPGYANLSLTGVDLRAGLTVRIGGARVADARQSDTTRWAVRTPAGPHGPVDVEVRNADGRGVVLSGAFEYRRFEDGTGESGLRAVGDCNDVSAADMDGDGLLDLVTANGAIGGIGQVEQPVGLHRGRPGGRFASEQVEPSGNGMNARLGDIDADGDLDVLVANLSSAQNRLYRNEGGRLVDDPAWPARGPSYDADFLDADGDGLLDVLLLQTGDPEDNAALGPEQLWRNQGGGQIAQVPGAVPFDLLDVHDHDVGLGDVNGDGLTDLVIVVDNISGQF